MPPLLVYIFRKGQGKQNKWEIPISHWFIAVLKFYQIKMVLNQGYGCQHMFVKYINGLRYFLVNPFSWSSYSGVRMFVDLAPVVFRVSSFPVHCSLWSLALPSGGPSFSIILLNLIWRWLRRNAILRDLKAFWSCFLPKKSLRPIYVFFFSNKVKAVDHL